MAKTFHDMCFKTTVSAEVEIRLVEADIYNWLADCKNPDILKYLGEAALRFAAAIENPETGDFRSRA